MKNVAQTVVYYAWDTSANTYKTGDSANHTLRGMQDGTEFTPAASPAEVDSTNLKGAYKVAIAATENTGNLMLLGGVSSTANIVLFPARWSNDPIPGVVRSGVAQAGGAATITLDSAASATNSLYNGCQVALMAGTGVGQGGRVITGYVGSTKVATVTPAWTTQPDSTSIFALIPAGVDVETWLVTAVTAATAGIPDANAKNINNVSTSSVTTINANQGTTQPVNFTGTAGSALVKVDVTDIATAAVATGSAQLGVNVVNIAGSAAALDANNLLKVDTEDWKGTAVSAPATAGIPDINLKNIANAAVSTSSAQIGVNAVQLGGTVQTGADVGEMAKAFVLDSGTAQTGVGVTITLRAGAPDFGANPKNAAIVITGGTGINQIRTFQSWNNATKVATVNSWATVPDNTSTYAVVVMSSLDGQPFPAHFNLLGIDGSGNIDAVNAVAEVITCDALTTNNDKTGYSLLAGQLFVKKNTQLANFMFVMTDSTTHAPSTGLTVACTRSIDGAAFANCTNTPATEVSNGWYKITLSAADLNGTVIALKFTSATADDKDLTVITQA